MTGPLEALWRWWGSIKVEIAEWYIPMVCQARPTWNKCKKKLANLGAEMASFGTPCQAHQPAHSFQHCWKTFDVDAQVVPATAQQTEEKNPCLHNTHN